MKIARRVENKQVRAIFFDLDDTLYDHTFAHAQATRSGMAVDVALRDISFERYENRASAILEGIHPSVVAGHLTFDVARTRRYELLADEFGGNRSLASAQATAHITAYRAAERAVPGAHALLNALKGAGYSLFIVSNNVRVEQEGKLARQGLNHFFDALIVSGDHAFAKPDPRLFAVALDIASVAAAQAIHVGDSYANDVAGAQAAGIRAIWLNRTMQPSPNDADVALQVVHDFTDQQSVIREITFNPR